MISLLLASMFGTAQAVPMQLSQQGRLVDSSGVTASGNHNLTFRLYNASTGGTLLWNETVSTSFTNGYYSVVLGSDTINNPLEDSVLESGDLYVEIEIDSDGPLTPRSVVTSAPFARVAGKAQVADSVDWSGLTSVPSGLDDADTRLAALEALMTTVQADLATANTTISTLESDLATTQSDLATAQSDLATTQSDLAAAQGDLTTANTTIASLQSSVGTNTTDIASNASDITGLDTDLTAAEGNITSLQASVTTNTTDIAAIQSDVTTLQGSVLDLIDTDTTWNIGSNGDYTDLEDAMAAARSVRIHPDATLTLQMANDIYTHTDPINLNHPDGANIILQGNSTDNALVKFVFDGDGFVIDKGHTFGGINDLTLEGSGTSHGVYIFEKSQAYLSNLDISSFGTGILAWYGSAVHLTGTNIVDASSSYGVSIRWNSVANGDGALEVTNSSADGVKLGYTSSADLYDLVSTGNGWSGISLFGGSSFWGNDADLSNNTKRGIEVLGSSSATSENSTIQSNGDTGIDVRASSAFYGNGSTVTGNGNEGIASLWGSNVMCNSCDISSNVDMGVVVAASGAAEIRNATISSNGDDGVFVGRNGTAWIPGSTITNNTGWGTYNFHLGFIYDYGATVSGNTQGNQSTSSSTFSVTE